MYRGAQEQQAQSNVEDIPTRSWYQSVFSSSSHPSTPSNSSSVGAHKRALDQPLGTKKTNFSSIIDNISEPIN